MLRDERYNLRDEWPNLRDERAMLGDERYNLRDELRRGGMVEISPGVFLATADTMLSEQACWDQADKAVTTDFTTYEYWLTTNDGAEPQGFDSIEEALTC